MQVLGGQNFDEPILVNRFYVECRSTFPDYSQQAILMVRFVNAVSGVSVSEELAVTDDRRVHMIALREAFSADRFVVTGRNVQVYKWAIEYFGPGGSELRLSSGRGSSPQPSSSTAIAAMPPDRSAARAALDEMLAKYSCDLVMSAEGQQATIYFRMLNRKFTISRTDINDRSEAGLIASIEDAIRAQLPQRTLARIDERERIQRQIGAVRGTTSTLPSPKITFAELQKTYESLVRSGLMPAGELRSKLSLELSKSEVLAAELLAAKVALPLTPPSKPVPESINLNPKRKIVIE